MVGEADSAGEAGVTDLVGELVLTDLLEGTLLLPVVVTQLADLPAVPLVGDSAGRGDFLLVDLLIAEITAALMTVVSGDAITIMALTIIAFAILMGVLSISALPTLDIQITPTMTHMRTTTTMGIQMSSVRCRKSWPN